jgi:oligo-1,6-glucosidase
MFSNPYHRISTLTCAHQIYGDFELLLPDHLQIFAFTRSLKSDVSALVVLNFSTRDMVFDTDDVMHLRGKAHLVLDNYDADGEVLADKVHLKGWQGKMFILYTS